MFLGIDPGQTGGIVALDLNGQIVGLERFDGQDLLSVVDSFLHMYEVKAVAIESVHAMPGQGVVSMFTFGVGFGKLQGFLLGKGVAPILYTPQSWKKILPPAATPKEAAKAFCLIRWGLDKFIVPGCRVPHSGAIDAACIAEFARQVAMGERLAPNPPKKIPRRQPIKLTG